LVLDILSQPARSVSLPEAEAYREREEQKRQLGEQVRAEKAATAARRMNLAQFLTKFWTRLKGDNHATGSAEPPVSLLDQVAEEL